MGLHYGTETTPQSRQTWSHRTEAWKDASEDTKWMIVQCATFPRVWFVEILRKKFRISVSGSRLNAVFGHPYSGDGPACWFRIQSGFRLKIWKIGIGFKFRVSTAILQTAGTDEHWKGIECDWICTSAIFVWLGWDSDSKLLKHLRSGTNLSCVTEKYLQKFLLQNGFCDCLDFIWA